MRLALHTDYALRTLMYLSSREERVSIEDVATFYAISRDHLAKVAQRLVREGYLRSIRGTGGGIELAKKPAEITIGEVVSRFEGTTCLLDCLSIDNVCVIQSGCRLRGVLAEAERRQMEYLNEVRLSDVVHPGEYLVQLTN